LRKHLLLLLVLLIVSNSGNCQSLVKTNWFKNIAPSGSGHISKICVDKYGNTYTFGIFVGDIDCLGQTLNLKNGCYFLLKQNAKGERIWAKNFGDRESYEYGDIVVDENSNIYVGISSYADTGKKYLKYDGKTLDSSINFFGAVLKIDRDGNLQWFKKFQTTDYLSVVTRLVIDNNENVYVSVYYAGSLKIEDKVLTRHGAFENCIIKINDTGNIEWFHDIYQKGSDSNSTANIISGVYYIQCKNNCPGRLVVNGSIYDVDTLIVDDKILFIKKHNQDSLTQFLFDIDDNGNIFNSNFLPSNLAINLVTNTTSFVVENNRMFFTCLFSGSVPWENNRTQAHSQYSIGVGEINDNNELVRFGEFPGKNIIPSKFSFSPLYGLVLCGSFGNYFILGSDSISITIPNTTCQGSLIANFDDSLKLIDVKYIKGYDYKILDMVMNDSFITTVADFGGENVFKDDTIVGVNSNIGVFQCSDLKRVSDFSPDKFIGLYSSVTFSVKIYPNPFETNMTMNFSEPIYSSSLQFYNIIGQKCEDINVIKINDTQTQINTTGLRPGIYFVNYLTCSGVQGRVKVCKMRN